MALAARARDFFFLRQAAAEAQRRPTERREAIGQALSLGRQRAEAAEALWSNGHAAEGLRLAVDALERTLDAAVVLAPEVGPEKRRRGVAPAALSVGVTAPIDALDLDIDDESARDATGEASTSEGSASERPSEASTTDHESGTSQSSEVAELVSSTEAFASRAAHERVDATPMVVELPSSSVWAAVLVARNLEAERVRTIERTVSLARQPLPDLDTSVSATHAELYKELFRARVDVDRALSPASLTVGQVRMKVTQRWTTTVLVLVLAAVGLFFALRTPRVITASSSSFFRSDPQFGPDRVFDGDPNTEWLLNDGQTGWIEARLSPGRSLTKIRILNGHNRHFNDRGAKEYQLELYDSSGQKVFEHAAELPFSESPSWVDVPVSAQGVERLRMNVTSFHRVGGALAEIAFEER